MKILDDICSSIAGNAKTRISDPFIGAFICSWIVCNWNYLSLLFWGEGKVTERVGAFYGYLAETPIWGWNYVFVIPSVIALFYLFLFPWISLVVKYFQHWANEKLHEQAVGTELSRVIQQEGLNKAKLKANPNKKFLEQIVQQELDKKEEILEHLKQRTIRLKAKAQEAKEKEKEQAAKTQEAENKANVSKQELEKKTKQAELEKVRFESNSAKARATLASHRFPSAYYLMALIESSLQQDDIQISLKASGEIVAALFGYDSFKALLDDKEFNNDTLEKIKYVYYDDELAKRLEQIVLDENSANEDFSANILFGHFEMLFEGEPFELVTGDILSEYCREMIENNPYDILNCDGVSGAIAESDTIFEYVEDIAIEDFSFDNGFYVELTANASGEHRREEGVPGRSMTISIKMQCDVLVGKFGLGSIEVVEISGTLDEFD
ncbi:hypothetical protein ACF8PD_01705 [Vibrio plantisponsor]|uniref:hypothetical protein n=1 Tax=Vibrio plantisponsor TaxID=664643 RepID=UPI00370A1EE9